jgi:Lipocalin-like domain
MTKSTSAVFALLLIVAGAPAPTLAGDNTLLGTWKLKSYVREVAATGERYNERGEHPTGYLSYAPDGRMYAIITWDNRPSSRDVVPTDEERVRLYRTMISYAGTYTVLADKVIHHVDISWNQNWTGTDQIRFYKLDGNTLTITSAPAKSFVDGREGRSILVWEKLAP